jgi:hypothetical protein
LSTEGYVLHPEIGHNRQTQYSGHGFSISDLQRESLTGLMKDGVTMGGYGIRANTRKIHSLLDRLCLKSSKFHLKAREL